MRKHRVSKSAQAAQVRAEQAQAVAQEAANNLQKNLAANLSMDNAAQVIAGGTAQAAGDMDMGGGLKKKRPTGTVSSQLGIV